MKKLFQGILLELPKDHIYEARCNRQYEMPWPIVVEEFDIPDDVPGGPDNPKEGVQGDIYDAYRVGLKSACTDVLVWARRPDGEIVYRLSLRSRQQCFGGKLWIQGGAEFLADTAEEFAAKKAVIESGANPRIELAVGLYYTGDFSKYKVNGKEVEHRIITRNLACFGEAEYDESLPGYDKEGLHDGESVWMTASEYNTCPESQRFWYINHLIYLCDITTPPAD